MLVAMLQSMRRRGARRLACTRRRGRRRLNAQCLHTPLSVMLVLLQSALALTIQKTLQKMLQSAMKSALLQTAVKLAMIHVVFTLALLQRNAKIFRRHRALARGPGHVAGCHRRVSRWSAAFRRWMTFLLSGAPACFIGETD